MGSFNTTCFASQQTIASGDPCYVLPILAQRGYRPVELRSRNNTTKESAYGVASSTCYPTGFWSIAGAFIEATYDDYGQVTLVKSPQNYKAVVRFLNLLAEKGLNVLEGENSCHDIPFDVIEAVEGKLPKLQAALKEERAVTLDEIWDEIVAAWDYVWGVGQEQRLFAYDYAQVVRPLQFAIIHKDSYDGLIALVEKNKTYDKQSLAMRAVFDRAMSSIQDVLFPKEAEAPASEAGKPASAVSMSRVFRAESRLRHEIYVGGFEGARYDDYENTWDALTKLVRGECSVDDLYAHMKPGLETRYVMEGLNILNIKLTPIVYAGQDYSNETGRDYARFVSKVSKQVSQRRKAYYGEND